MSDSRWRPPVDEALDMADAFREGVPLGWQRAFVALADAYRGAVAERDDLLEQVRDLTREERARNEDRITLMDGSTITPMPASRVLGEHADDVGAALDRIDRVR